MQIKLAINLIVTILLLAGCSGRHIRTIYVPSGPEPMNTSTYGATQEHDSKRRKNTRDNKYNEADANTQPPPQGLLAIQAVMFDIDSSIILPAGIATLRAHGNYLATHPQYQITVEGHGDNGGSREYNLALGERRAQTVKKFLMAEGVDPGQIKIFSYGEEKPIDTANNSDAWARNRRVELVY